MTDRFIDNFTPGDGTDGLTWAKAELTAAAVDAVDAAGDRWLFDSRHSESTASAVTLSVAGSVTTPSQLLSVTQSGGSGASSLTVGAIVATSGANNLTLNGVFYAYGIKWSCGSGASAGTLAVGGADNSVQTHDNCHFICGTSNAGQRLTFGTASSGQEVNIVLINPTLKFGSTSQGLFIQNAGVEIRGGSIDGTGSAITTFIATATTNSKLLVVDGFDFSNAASSLNLIASGSAGQGRYIFRNCKLPASWSGGVFAGAPALPGVVGEMWNCSAGDTNYAMWVEDYAGSIKHETTIVHTGGASDGDTALSWKMASSANAEYPVIVLRSPEIFVPNTTVGASKTLTVEIAQDGTTTALNDDEIWLEVEYLGTSGVPLALFARDCKADVLATAAAQDTSSESWSGLSGTNKKQYLQKAVTPQEEGVFIVRVCLAKASTTVYVDPKVTVS